MRAAPGSSRILFRDRVARGAALTPDGSKLALALDNRIDLYDAVTGQRLASTDVGFADSRRGLHRRLLFSRDGRFLLSTSKPQSSFVLWHLDSERARQVDLGGHEVLSVAFSPDSSRLAIAVADRTVRVVDTATGRSRKLGGHRDLVWQVAWSPDGKRLASASYDRTIRLWDPVTGRVRVLRGHSGSVDLVGFTRDGGTLVSASADGTVRRWNLMRLPEDRVDVIAQRLSSATSAVIDRGGQAVTTTAATESTPGAQVAGSSSGAGSPSAAVLAPAR